MLIVVLASTPSLARLAADWYWFQELGFETIFLKALGTKLALGIGIGALAFVFFYGNLRIAQRGIVPDPRRN